MNFFIRGTFFILLILGFTAHADVPMPGVEMPENIRVALSRLAEGADSSNLAQIVQHKKSVRAQQLMSAQAEPIQVAVPLLLGRYSNANNSFSQSDFQNQIFDNNPTGTMIDYYREVSYGQFELSGAAFGWHGLPETQKFYVGEDSGLDGGGARFARDLAVAADPEVDYSQYDADNDGYVDVIMVVHTGAGAETGVSSNIWSHRWSLASAASYNPNKMPQGEYITNDPWPGHPGQFIKINDYIIQPELARSTGGLVDIGVFCHEFGHAIGLPDLYDTDYSSSGIGRWGLMAGGSYGGDGSHSNSPAHMCAWSKEFLGWVEPTVIDLESLSVSILNVEENQDQVFKVYMNGEPGPEYFLIENRQKLGFDRYLSGSGLLIWHIDQDIIDAKRRSNSVNNDERKKGVDLEEADGRADLDSNRSNGDSGDPFPGTSFNTLFNSSSNPESASNENVDSGVAIQIDNHENQIISASFLLKPDLYVYPAMRSVAYDSGVVAFTISNVGGGAMSWTAQSNASWLSIEGEGVGVNKGELYISFTANTSQDPRTGNVFVTADGSEMAEIIISQTAAGEWILSMDVVDDGGEQATLAFGQRFDATDDLDIGLGEAVLPGAPQSGMFDARLEFLDGESASLSDFRAPGAEWMQWRMLFQAGDGGYPIELSWDRNQLPAGSFLIQDEFTGTLISIDMKLTDSYVVPTSSIKSLKITYSDTSPQTVAINDGWNLVSIPFSLVEARPDKVFPEALSSTFIYNSGYQSVQALQPGMAYWMKFAQPREYKLFGVVVSPAEIALTSGWNMIGPFDQQIDVASISTEPANIIDSEFYGFDGTYDAANVLIPGRGYWLKAAQDGIISFSTMPVAKSSRSEVDTKSLATLIFTDAQNQSKMLFISTENVQGFHLPPLPPGDAWDVRFEDDRQISVTGKSKRILIRGAQFPVSVKVVNSGPNKLSLNNAGIAAVGSVELREGADYQLAGAADIILESEKLPGQYMLLQNYPNPFNPMTTIKFSAPEKEHAILSVYNSRGQFIENVIDGILEAGWHNVNINAENYASGLYIYRLQIGEFSMSKKMIVLR
jgi:M6 family metalloprotease-like protein